MKRSEKESTFEGFFDFLHNEKRTQRYNARRGNNGGGVFENRTRKAQAERDYRDIRYFEVGNPIARGRNSVESARTLRTAASERLLRIAEQEGLFISPKRFRDRDFGTLVRKRTGESAVYTDGVTFTKVKDPFAKQAIKKTHAEDAIYEHIIHNLLFPNTRYTFVGISEDCGDVRIVLSQKAIKTYDQPTSKQIRKYLENVLGLEKEDRYTWGNDYYSITDVSATSDNVLLGEDGELYFIDPLIKLKRCAKDVINYLINEPDELSGVKKTAAKNGDCSELLRKYNIDLKRFEPFVSKDDLRPVMECVYFDPEGYLVATDACVLLVEPTKIPDELSGKLINLKTENELKDAHYPQWRSVIPTKHEYTTKIDVEKTLQIIKVADRLEKVLNYHINSRSYDYHFTPYVRILPNNPDNPYFKHNYANTIFEYVKKWSNGKCEAYSNEPHRACLVQASNGARLLLMPVAGHDGHPYITLSPDNYISFKANENYWYDTNTGFHEQFCPHPDAGITIDELNCIALAHLRDYQLIDYYMHSLQWTLGVVNDKEFRKRFGNWRKLTEALEPLSAAPKQSTIELRREKFRSTIKGEEYKNSTVDKLCTLALLVNCNDGNCSWLAHYIEKAPITVPNYKKVDPLFDLMRFVDFVAKDPLRPQLNCVYFSPKNYVQATDTHMLIDIAALAGNILTTPELKEKGLLIHPDSGIRECKYTDYPDFSIIYARGGKYKDLNIDWDDINKALRNGKEGDLIRFDNALCVKYERLAAAYKWRDWRGFEFAKFRINDNMLCIQAGLSTIVIMSTIPMENAKIIDIISTDAPKPQPTAKPTTDDDRARRLRLAQARAAAAIAILALIKLKQNVNN